MVLDYGDKLKQSLPPSNVLNLTLRIPPKMMIGKKNHKYCLCPSLRPFDPVGELQYNGFFPYNY